MSLRSLLTVWSEVREVGIVKRKLKNTARKGASFENKLLNNALYQGIIFGMRGASSKSRSADPNLKIDIVLIQNQTLFVIQAKHHKQKATNPEKERFYSATLPLSFLKLSVKPAFIETEEELDELLKSS